MSTVTAVAEETGHTPREWKRDAEQEEVVAEYRRMIAEMYAGAAPAYLAELSSEEILGTPELVKLLRYKRTTRVFQLYGQARDLAEADQVPHPGAMPFMDAFGGMRGPREIRGVDRGRIMQWWLQSGRGWWDSINGRPMPQEDINHGGRIPKARSRREPTDEATN